jgi:hypothetical protein
MIQKTTTLLLCCICLLAVPAGVRADGVPIFSNLGPFVSSSNPGYDALQIACIASAIHSCEAEFTSLGDFRLTQLVEPQLTHSFGQNAFPISVLTLYTDVNGSPGQAIDQFGVPFRGLLGEFPPVPPFTETSALEPLLFAGQSYWLVLSNSNTVFDSFAYWAANSTGDVGPIIGIGAPGGNATPITFGTRPAFELDGTPVPEPSSLFLFGPGTAALVTFFLRRSVHGH